jgi:iron complex outermembrane receptor protein
MRKLILLLTAVVSLFALNEDDFLKTLNEVSEIATKTKLNIDKTPSNVDVIRRDFILKSGAKTLLDVLKFIPGIEISISSSGKKELIIRGNKSTYRDKIKFMINGVDVTNALYSNQFYYYNFPAVLIKRIEFTKTPDSVLYGGTAFLGVINVITVDEYNDNFVNFYFSDKNQLQGVFFGKFKKAIFDLYYSYSNPDIYSPPTYLIDLQKYYAYVYRNPTRANTLEKNLGLGVKYKFDEVNSLSYRLQFYKKGDFFGITRLTPLKDDKFIYLTHQYINFKHEHYITSEMKHEINMGVKFYNWKGQYRVFPYDFNETVDNNPENDVIVGACVHEFEYYIKDQFTYEKNNHNLVTLLSAKYVKPYDYYYQQYVESLGDEQNLFNLGPEGEHLTGDYNIFPGGIYRRNVAVAVQDLYTFNKNFSAISGVRFDNYNDFGNHFSYKIGGVYNISKRTTLKLIFNNAYRVPSFIELYARSNEFMGNSKLKPETLNMLETIMIQKFSQSDKLKFVYYYGVNDNYIGREYSLDTGIKTYQNLGTYYIRGFELSYDKILDSCRFYISYSYNDNYFSFSNYINGINVYDWPGNRKHLIKSYFTYNLNNSSNVFISCLYGSKIDTPTEYVDNINPYFSLNANYSFKIQTTSIKFGIDNITNHKNYFWIDPSNIIFNRYIFEFENARVPDIGRKIYVSFTKRW